MRFGKAALTTRGLSMRYYGILFLWCPMEAAHAYGHRSTVHYARYVTFTTGGKLERPQPRFVYSWI